MRTYQVQHVNTAAGYLLIHDQMTDANCRDGHCYEPSRKCEKISRITILGLLYISTGHVLQQLTYQALQGLRIKTEDNMRLRKHVVFRSYVSNNPVTEDMLALKRGGKTNAPCYRCISSRADLAKGTRA